jgi:ABC-2 type transport system permease protein
MVSVFRYALSRSRFTILIWALSLGAYGAYMLMFYDTFVEQREIMEELLRQYPPELLAAFGGMVDLFSPGGYLTVYFFSYMPLVIGIFALLAGSGLLVGDEESGILDLIMAHPISRKALFFGRLSALVISLILILFITWSVFALVVPGTMLEVSLQELSLPFVSLLAVLTFFASLGLLLSLLLPSRSIAAMTTGLVLMGSFFLVTLAELNPDLEGVARFSPLTYYQGGHAVEGMNWAGLAGLMGMALLFTLLAWWSFERRDIRVAGEGGWRLPWRARRALSPDQVPGE